MINNTRASTAICRLFLAVALCVLPSACQRGFMTVDVKPSREPMFNMTQSSHVLACVGRRIDRLQAPPIDVYVSDIPDHTTPSIESSFLTKNAVMMVTTAIDRLGTESVQVVGKNGARPGRRQVQILGAFTELNRTIGSDAASAKSRWPAGLKFDLGVDQSFNHIAVDMALSELNRIIPNTATSTSVEIQSRSGNTTLTYDEGGDYAAVAALGFTAQEGFHSAERLLIETTLAIMISRYYQLDITDCLQRSKNWKAPSSLSSRDEPVFPAYRGGPRPSLQVIQDIPRRRTGMRLMRDTWKQEPATRAPNGAPVNLRSEPQGLPVEEQESVIVLPRTGAKNRFITEQPVELSPRKSGEFSGSTRSGEGFIDQQPKSGASWP